MAGRGICAFRGVGTPVNTGRSRTIRTWTALNCTTPRSNRFAARSEEHTSELQSRLHLVCRLLLEKKKKKYRNSAPDNTRATFLRRQSLQPPSPTHVLHYH